MISLQEKKTAASSGTAVNDSIASYARRELEGATAGKLDILSQLESGKARNTHLTSGRVYGNDRAKSTRRESPLTFPA